MRIICFGSDHSVTDCRLQDYLAPQVVFYSNGKKIGPAWEFKIGGGLLVGHVDQRGELTGEDLVYAYPDFTTLLVGKFSSGIMMGAKQTTLTGIKFDKITKVPYILYDKKLLQASKQVFAFQEPTKTSVGLDPLVQGPMLQNFFAVTPEPISKNQSSVTTLL